MMRALVLLAALSSCAPVPAPPTAPPPDVIVIVDRGPDPWYRWTYVPPRYRR